MRFSSRLALVGGFFVFLVLPSLGCQKLVADYLGNSENAGQEGKATPPPGTPENPSTPQGPASRPVPEDFPKSVPIYPGATVTSGTSFDNPGQKVSSVGLQTSDAADKVAAYYKAQLPTAGLQDTNDLPNNPVAGFIRILTFTDTVSGCVVSVTLQPNAGDTGTTILINAAK
ncbi:MAG: hypothetical protein ABIP39_16855, partial [Polyangiaceae bacterium]